MAATGHRSDGRRREVYAPEVGSHDLAALRKDGRQRHANSTASAKALNDATCVLSQKCSPIFKNHPEGEALTHDFVWQKNLGDSYKIYINQ